MSGTSTRSRSEVREQLGATADWLWGIIAGNFDNRPKSTSQTIVAGIISMVPGIDQIMDVRDVLGSLFIMSDPAGRTTDNTVELAFTLIGLVPVVGSAGRTGLRLLYDGKGVTQAVAHLHSKEKGDALGWLKSLKLDAHKTTAFSKAEKGLKLLDDIAASLRKHNTGIKAYLIPDNVITAAESLARTARKTWGEVKGSVEQAFKTIQAKIDTALGRAKKETRPAATTTTNVSARPQREVKRSTKGLVCEGKAAAYMAMMGYDMISVDLDIPQGLDGVFEHDGKKPGRNVTAPVLFDPESSKPPPYPKFVVLEAKFDGTGKPSGSKKGKLKQTQTGRQGSKAYVEGNRLEQAVGKTKAAKIRTSANGKGPASWLFVCMSSSVVKFIDIKKQWPSLYAPTTGGAKPPSPPTPRRRTR